MCVLFPTCWSWSLKFSISAGENDMAAVRECAPDKMQERTQPPLPFPSLSGTVCRMRLTPPKASVAPTQHKGKENSSVYMQQRGGSQ